MAENVNPYVGFARATLGQGLGMGWGDEAEAWLRSKLGNEDYESALNRIRKEYGAYSEQHPVASSAGEFAGGFAPGAVMMMVPGGQAAGAAALGRSTMGGLARLAATGAATGAVSGAGSAEDSRLSGAGSGAVAGGLLGTAIPLGMRGASGAAQWLRERLAPTSGYIAERAADKMNRALRESKMTPRDIERGVTSDRALGVPSVVANVDRGLTDLAETVAQRTGAGARTIEEKLGQQKLGAKERTHQQMVKGLNPGDYYDDLEKLSKEMSARAGPAYKKAYAYGEVSDPEVLKFMELPQFKQAMTEAERLLAAEGRKLDTSKPTVEVLDQVKRGLDTLIEKETDALTGKTTALGRVYVQEKNKFLQALDKAVPDYELARGIYAGGAELQDAMRRGLNDFGRMDHEQVMRTIAKMSSAEKEAFRTGVSRQMYSTIMNPSSNFNAAQRIIGSPEMQAKLQPLFNSAGEFNLFKAALEREAQLFHQANQILGGSQTGKRMQMREQFDEQSPVGDAIARAVTGGFWSSLTGLAAGAIRSGQISEKTAEKLAGMLMSKDPHEVASVVKMLEDQAARAAPKAVRASAAESGAVTGAASSVFPAPAAEGTLSIESDIEGEAPKSGSGPDIEADILRESAPQR